MTDGLYRLREPGSVIQVQSYGNFGFFCRLPGDSRQVTHPGMLQGCLSGLDHNRRLHLFRGPQDSVDAVDMIDAESPNGVSSLVRILKQASSRYEWHTISPFPNRFKYPSILSLLLR